MSNTHSFQRTFSQWYNHTLNINNNNNNSFAMCQFESMCEYTLLFCFSVFLVFFFFFEKMEPLRYFQAPCLSGLVEYSLKGKHCGSSNAAIAAPQHPYGWQVWKKAAESKPDSLLLLSAIKHDLNSVWVCDDVRIQGLNQLLSQNGTVLRSLI